MRPIRFFFSLLLTPPHPPPPHKSGLVTGDPEVEEGTLVWYSVKRV